MDYLGQDMDMYYLGQDMAYQGQNMYYLGQAMDYLGQTAVLSYEYNLPMVIWGHC